MFLSSIVLPWAPKTKRPTALERPREIWLVMRPARAPVQTLKGNSVQGQRAHVALGLRSMDGAGTKTVQFPTVSPVPEAV